MDIKGQRPLGRDEFNTWVAELLDAPPFVKRLAWEAICAATAESGTELTVDSALDFVAHVGERSHASGAAYLNRRLKDITKAEFAKGIRWAELYGPDYIGKMRRHRSLPDWRIAPRPRYSKAAPLQSEIVVPQNIVEKARKKASGSNDPVAVDTRKRPGPKPKFGKTLSSTERSRLRRARLKAAVH
jgi:hypothetical protein